MITQGERKEGRKEGRERGRGGREGGREGGKKEGRKDAWMHGLTEERKREKKMRWNEKREIKQTI